MRAGNSGRIAILWKQTEIDGLEAAPLSFLNVGAAWSWRGQAFFLTEAEQIQREQSGGTGRAPGYAAPFPDLEDQACGSVVLTNGAQEYKASLFLTPGETAPVLVFEDGYPLRDQEFWISNYSEIKRHGAKVSHLDDKVVAFPSRSKDDEGPIILGRRTAVNARSMAD